MTTTQKTLAEFDEKFTYKDENENIFLLQGFDKDKNINTDLIPEIKSFLQTAIEEARQGERKHKKREFIKNEIKILQKRIDELPEMIGGADGENYELWNNVIKYLKKELKGK